MQKVQQFRQRARECRYAAATASTAELRKHYENIASVWDKLADERVDFFLHHPDSKTRSKTHREAELESET